MRTDDYSPAMEFQPGGSFVKPLKLDLKFVGMKLERYNLSNGKTDFFYIADDGTMVVIKNDGLSVNLAEKKAEVKGAELKHFSRYGFIRKFSQESSSSSYIIKERNNKMKKTILTLSVLGLLFLIGCQENNITQPYDENSNNSNGTLLKSGEPNWIGLPYTKGTVSTNGSTSLSSVSKTIRGRDGGDLSIKKEYP